MTARTVNVAAGGRRADIECAWIEAGAAGLSLRASRFGADSPSGRPVGATGLPYALRASGQFALGSGPSRSLEPVLVFLHEGLGSLSMWKDFPAELCAALGMRGLVYSRPGYGKSTPRASGERWPVDFMQRQASEVLPALLAALDVPPRPWLFGHSDGASIALLFAAAFPDAPAGVVALAPHLFVEDLSVTSIEATRSAYRSTDLRTRLARYHDDPDSAFFGWNDIWLDPAFRAWNIEREVQRIRCPVLAIQGEDDEYGTMAQVDRLAHNVPQARVVKLSQCGHSPHRDQPDRVVDAVASFVRGL